MTRETFWQLIDDARHASSRLVQMPQRLVDMLSRLDEQEIVDFESHYIGCLHQAYDARLWLAAVVMMHGCGDDTFSDFRGWLIAQGRECFESALAEPDSLANVNSFDGDEEACPTLFYFGSAAPRAFCKRSTGHQDDPDACTKFHQLYSVPAYPPLKNRDLINLSDEQARQMFPKLAARCPEAPHTSPFT